MVWLPGCGLRFGFISGRVMFQDRVRVWFWDERGRGQVWGLGRVLGRGYERVL